MKKVDERKYYFNAELSMSVVESRTLDILGKFYGSFVVYVDVMGEIDETWLDLRVRMANGVYVSVVIRYNENLNTWIASFEKIDK